MNEENFGRYLRVKRKEKGVTLKELSDSLKVSLSYLAQIERGEKKLSSLDTMYKLIGQLNVDEIEFLVNAGATNEVKRLHLKELDKILNSIAESWMFDDPFFNNVIAEVFEEIAVKEVTKNKKCDFNEFSTAVNTYFNEITEIKSRSRFLVKFKKISDKLDARLLQNKDFGTHVRMTMFMQCDSFEEILPSTFVSRLFTELKKIKFKSNLDNELFLNFLNAKNIDSPTSSQDIIDDLTYCFSSIIVDTESRDMMYMGFTYAISRTNMFINRDPEETFDLSYLCEYSELYFDGRLLDEEERGLVDRILFAILDKC